MGRIVSFIICTLVFLQSPVLAQSASKDMGTIVSAELIPGWRRNKTTHMAALRINLAPGWKTYWRAPGGSGVPPQFDWSGSHNIKAVKYHWPAPSMFIQNGIRTIGYKHQLLLPVELVPIDPTKHIQAELSLDFGVCSDVCVPIQTDISAMIPRKTAQGRSQIETALAAGPVTSQAAGVKSVTCRLDPLADGFQVTAIIGMAERANPDSFLIFELGDPNLWINEARTSVSGRNLTSTAKILNFGQDAFFFDRENLRMTLLSKRGAIDIRGCKAS